MTDAIHIEVKGIEKIQAAFNQFKGKISEYMGQAGREAASREILPTEGLQKYPPSGPGNAPPTPYYIRGVGTQYKYGNLNNSERLGTRFYVKPVKYGVEIGNTASYGKYVYGRETQSARMAKIGWRKLWDVAVEKMARITAVYQAWINKLISDLGL